MAVKSIEIDAGGGELKVEHNVLEVRQGDTVKWNVVNLDKGRRVDIEFELQGGVCGPFDHDPADANNPARGWYGTDGKKPQIKSNALRHRGTWKYDVVLTDCSSGRELHRKDPWIKFP